MTKGRPQQPVYPRPVSPLTYEPLNSKGCHIYYNDDTDSDIDSDRNATKRRKIEKLGEQYLRGDGLFIMSASLKGSLEGWQNPWLKSRKKAAQRTTGRHSCDTEAIVPETTRRPEISRRWGPEVSATSVRARESSAGAETHPEQPNRVTAWNEPVQGHPGRRGHSGSDKKVTPLDKGDRTQVHERDQRIGQNWLKKVRTSAAPAFVERDDSPTPRSAKLRNDTANGTHKDEGHDHEARDLRYINQGKDSSQARHDSDPNFAPTPTPSATVGNSAVTDLEVPLRSSKMTKGSVQGHEDVSNLVQMRGKQLAHESCGDKAGMTRIRNRPLNGKRGSIHYLPPSTHLPDFEYRPAVREVQHTPGNATLNGPGLGKEPQDDLAEPKILAGQLQTHLQDTVIPTGQAPVLGREGSSADRTAMPGVSVVTHSAPPTRSAAQQTAFPVSASTPTTTASDLPSAQIVPDISSACVNSSASTSCKLIGSAKKSGQMLHTSDDDIPVTTELRTDSLKIGTPSAADPGGPDQPQADEHQHGGIRQPPRGHVIKPFSAFRSPCSNPPANLDTQAMLDAITPLGFSTIKKIPLKSASKSTPRTATRLPPKARKRASFVAPTTLSSASGSSQGSIKDVLKTSKGAAQDPNSHGPKAEDLPIFEGLDLDMETSKEEMDQEQSRPLPEAPSLLRHVGNHPVDQARRTPASSAMPLTRDTTTSNTSHQQDAQNARQNDVDGEGVFDLSSAMDDLGSFLGTWDPDKAAKDLGVVAMKSRKPT